MAPRKQEIDPLDHYPSYAFIPYITPQDPSSPPLTLNTSSIWTYCGPKLSPTSPLPPSYHTWAKATVSSPSGLSARLLPILAFLQNFLDDAGAQNYWLTLRAMKPTDEYDIPRWHTDAHFFPTEESPDKEEEHKDEASIKSNPWTKPNRRRKASSKESIPDSNPGPDLSPPNALGFTSTSPSRRDWKLCTTLLGPGTLFQSNNEPALSHLRSLKSSTLSSLGPHTCTSLRCLGCETYATHLRSALASSLPSGRKDGEVSQTPEGHVAFFRVGDKEGAVHSEPRCDVDRVFVNVVPGTEGELRGLMGRFGMGFPRGWCFGVPAEFDRDGNCEEAEECGS